MSLQQYYLLISNLLKEKCSLTKLREELEGRKEKLCRNCKKFGHLACNCRNKKKGEEGTIIPQNKFEVLRSRVMQCGVEERTIRRQEVIVVECFKCGEQGHKCKECPLWEKMRKEKRLRREEEERAVHPIREKVQKAEMKLKSTWSNHEKHSKNGGEV